jgi:hypothetical protein
VEIHPAAVALNTGAGRDNHNRNKADGKQAIRFVILLSVYVVDPANLDWNLLLADLRKLSAIVENEEEENTAYEKPAAPAVRQKQPVSNNSRL